MVRRTRVAGIARSAIVIVLLGMPSEAFFTTNNWLIWVAILWSLPWKGWALWRAAQRRETWWFIVLFLVNTVGLLDMIYLFVVSKRQASPALQKGKNNVV